MLISLRGTCTALFVERSQECTDCKVKCNLSQRHYKKDDIIKDTNVRFWFYSYVKKFLKCS